MRKSRRLRRLTRRCVHIEKPSSLITTRHWTTSHMWSTTSWAKWQIVSTLLPVLPYKEQHPTWFHTVVYGMNSSPPYMGGTGLFTGSKPPYTVLTVDVSHMREDSYSLSPFARVEWAQHNKWKSKPRNLNGFTELLSSPLYTENKYKQSRLGQSLWPQ